VSYEELGTATSGVTFFRSIGGSFGTAVFGAIFANVLVGNLARQLEPLGIRTIPGGAAGQIDNPALVAKLPPEVHHAVSVAIADTIDRVFLIGVPIAFLAFLLSWLLPEIELRKSVRTNEPGQGFTVPSASTSLEELQLNLERIVARENRVDLYTALASRAGLDIPPQACWLLYRVADLPTSTVDSVATRLRVPPDIIEPGVEGLVAAGFIERSDGTEDPERQRLRLTPAGESAMARLAEARRQGLTELLEGWDLDDHPEVVAMVRRLADELLADDQKMLVAAGMHPTG
jgi:DNA-binding MarR family transcriptional regulator